MSLIIVRLSVPSVGVLDMVRERLREFDMQVITGIMLCEILDSLINPQLVKNIINAPG